LRQVHTPDGPWLRALAVLAGMLLLLGVTAAQVPGPWHRDDAPHACPICKLGCQPLPAALFSALVQPLTPPGFFVSPAERRALLSTPRRQTLSRGPPAWPRALA
jgi:hypothetical protein